MRALIIIAALLLAWPAQAQQLRMCPGGQSYEEVETLLDGPLDRGGYAETAYARAVMASGRAVLEFWSNPTTGTWTIIGVTPQECAWVISGGEGWKAITPEPGEDGA